MTYHLDEYFRTPLDQDNPDVVVKYEPKFDEYGIPIYDGGSSVIVINYCPWCGTKLPESKRDLWFDTLEELGIDPANQDSIPETYQSEKWYQKKDK